MTGERENTTSNWDSDPGGMMDYYQAMSYTLGQSIADLVDNSYDAKSKRIDITINLDSFSGAPFIRIYDDGNGISSSQIDKAMTLGVKRQRSETELGVYGIGMKLSALSQAHEVTVVSKKDSAISIRRISSHHIKENNANELLHYPTNSKTFTESFDEFHNGKWSTMILLEDVHRSSKWQLMNKGAEQSLMNEINKVKIHLGLTYHRIIKNNPGKSLRLNGREISAQDPFMSWEDDIDYGTVKNDAIINMKINGDEVNVSSSMIIIPHEKRMKDGKRCRAINSGYKRKNFMQGFYLYRNDRLIDYGEWQSGLFGDNVDPHHSLAKMSIDIPPQHSTLFGLGPTKTNVDLPIDFLRKIDIKIKEKRVWGPIKNGAEMSFYDAFLYRYNNEGKKKKKVTTKQPTITSSGVLPPPTMMKKSSIKQIKPSAIITNIEEENNKIILTVDKSHKSFEDLKSELRKWTP
jgi:hypothetical protein